MPNNVLHTTARFRVDPRLATLLGEGYRSSEHAIKELIDNAWDADATRVEISLPEACTTDPVVVSDNGSGMTSNEVERDYLVIANDRRTRKGEHTHGLHRLVRGRKGIGKFAGLMVADVMEIETRTRGTKTHLRIRKEDLPSSVDLEAIDLPISTANCNPDEHGTAVRLYSLSQALAFPSPDRLKQLLVLDYGRNEEFELVVNGNAVSVDDIPGQSFVEEAELPVVGFVRLAFTIAEGKKPLKQAGVAIRVTGKVIGKPGHLGLEGDGDLPTKLLRKVYGELDADGLADDVTADWGAVIENSVAYGVVEGWAAARIKDAISKVFANEVNLAKARRQQEINRRLELLPEHRRQYAEAKVERVLAKYWDDRDDRMDTILSVAFDAMEFDEYFAVLKAVDEAPTHDVAKFAIALDQFGLADMAMMADQAQHRLTVLGRLDDLLLNDDTREAEMHRALEHNLWILGAGYALLSSNVTLRAVISQWTGKEFTGDRAAKRPDLLLCNSISGRHVLIEFKRPSHLIGRDDENQAVKYRDDLRQTFDAIEILLIGKGRTAGVDPASGPPNLAVTSYAALVSRARTELTWLLGQLTTAQS